MPAVPKPSHGRNSQKRGNLTNVTNKVRKEIARRSMELWDSTVPCCEHCGRTDMLTAAHMVNASQMGPGSIPWNVMLICGSHGWKDRCHDWIDHTPAGNEWRKGKIIELREYYDSGPGRRYWRYAE